LELSTKWAMRVLFEVTYRDYLGLFYELHRGEALKKILKFLEHPLNSTSFVRAKLVKLHLCNRKT
jgi:hypothetical protein